MQQFKAFLKDNQIDYTDADIAGVNDWIKANIKSELFTSQFGQLEGLKVARRMGSADRQGRHLPARSPDPRRPLQTGPEDHRKSLNIPG